MTKKRIITANELASYVVCPEAWKLKQSSDKQTQSPERKKTAAKERQEWIDTHSSLTEFKLYAKVAYVLLVMLVIVVFLMELGK